MFTRAKALWKSGGAIMVIVVVGFSLLLAQSFLMCPSCAGTVTRFAIWTPSGKAAGLALGSANQISGVNAAGTGIENKTVAVTAAGSVSVPVDIKMGSELIISNTAPTISSGFGTSPSISANNGTAAFRVNVGTGGAASSGVIGLPAATTGWNCFCQNLTTFTATRFICRQTASTTTSVTVGNFTNATISQPWVASDILEVSCFAF